MAVAIAVVVVAAVAMMRAERHPWLGRNRADACSNHGCDRSADDRSRRRACRRATGLLRSRTGAEADQRQAINRQQSQSFH